MEHATHARVGGDARQLGLHGFEERTCGFGPLVGQVDPVLLGRLGVDEAQGGAGIGQDVLAGPVEELVGQGQVLGMRGLCPWDM